MSTATVFNQKGDKMHKIKQNTKKKSDKNNLIKFVIYKLRFSVTVRRNPILFLWRSGSFVIDWGSTWIKQIFLHRFFEWILNIILPFNLIWDFITFVFRWINLFLFWDVIKFIYASFSFIYSFIQLFIIFLFVLRTFYI